MKSFVIFSVLACLLLVGCWEEKQGQKSSPQIAAFIPDANDFEARADLDQITLSYSNATKEISGDYSKITVSGSGNFITITGNVGQLLVLGTENEVCVVGQLRAFQDGGSSNKLSRNC